MVKVKAAQLAAAASAEGSAEADGAMMENGKINMNWVEHFVKRWMARNGLKTRAVTNKVKLAEPELAFRAHAFFRNLVRVRAAYEPDWLNLDAYGRSPFYFRMSRGAGLGVAGAKQVAHENTGDSRPRFTVVVPGSTDSTPQNPSAPFKGANPSSRKGLEAVSAAAGKEVYAQYNAKRTYDEQATICLLENQYSALTPPSSASARRTCWSATYALVS